MDREKIALAAQRIMERIFDGDYLETIIAPVGMELWRYGFVKYGKEGEHQRWIRREVIKQRRKQLTNKPTRL